MKPSRLLSLDVLRGITIAGMILVNNPGSWGHIYAPLEHAEWIGLTPTDLVFPFFMFIMGVSTYLSLRKYDFAFSLPTLCKILRRTVVIFFLGLFLAWLGLTLRGALRHEMSLCDAATQFESLRLLGVMPRLALCYGIGSLLALTFRGRALPWLVGALLAAYAVVLLVGHGWDFCTENILYRVDCAILGPRHMYGAIETIHGVSMQFEPEGLLSTLPAIAHMLIGFLCGKMLVEAKNHQERMLRLFVVGTTLTFAGFLLAYGLPISKKIWSPTFVLVTCGMASTLLALLIWVVDAQCTMHNAQCTMHNAQCTMHNAQCTIRWSRFFEAFGANPLFIYCLGTLLTLGMMYISVPCAAAESGTLSLKGYIYEQWLVPLCHGHATFASLLFALLFVALNWSVAYALYRRRIYIKI